MNKFKTHVFLCENFSLTKICGQFRHKIILVSTLYQKFYQSVTYLKVYSKYNNSNIKLIPQCHCHLKLTLASKNLNYYDCYYLNWVFLQPLSVLYRISKYKLRFFLSTFDKSTVKLFFHSLFTVKSSYLKRL